MSERSAWIDKLINNYISRVAYTKAKISVNISSQIKALRNRRGMTQKVLGEETGMLQSRISAMERPGATSLTIDTLARLASAFNVGLIVKFAPFSEMLKWENEYNQDVFDVIGLEKDMPFLEPKEYAGLKSDIWKIVYLKQPSCGVEGYTDVTKQSSSYALGQQQIDGIDWIEQGNITELQIMQVGG
jgi:transcriptional regulator with XRE-family HTH domain